MDWEKRAKKRRRKSDIYVPIILLAPAFLLVVGVIVYPICYAVGLSFQYYKLTDIVNRHFVGLENQQINGVPAQINVYEGEYKYELAHTGLDITEYYTVIVENVTDDSFDFTIYYADDLADTRDVVFRTHTAIFEGDGTYARYHGTEYNLEFTFPNDRNTLPDAVDMQISGYEPVEGLTFCNHAIPGHEFS